jgi:hypothetical protein
VQLQIKAVALSREMVEATEGNTETLYHRLERFKHLLNSRDTLFQSMLADITTLLCKTSPEDQAELTSEHIIACALRLHKELISQRSETSYYISELIYLAFEHYQDNKSPEQPTYIPLVNVADSSLEVRESLYLYSLMVAILEWLPYNFQLNHVTNTALNITTLENEAGQLPLQVTLGHSLLSSAALHTDRLLGPLLRLTTFLIQVDETNLNRMVITAPRLS